MSSEEATGTAVAAAGSAAAADIKMEELRITPRTSLLQGESVENELTPHAMLQHLAQIDNANRPKTPERTQVPSQSARRSARRTPGARRLDPKSPHTLRAMQIRATPSRRRSIVGHRESDRDYLRHLSRQLATNSQIPEATPKPTPRSARRPRHPSDVVFYPNPTADDEDDDDNQIAPPGIRLNYSNYGDDSEDAIIPPQFNSDPEDLNDVQTRDPRRHSSVDTRRDSMEVGLRATKGPRQSWGFYPDDVLGDISFGTGQMNAVMNMDNSTRDFGYDPPPDLPCVSNTNRERGDDSQWISEAGDQRTSPIARMSVVSDHDEPFDDVGPSAMLPPSDDSDGFQFDMPMENTDLGGQLGAEHEYEDIDDMGPEGFQMALDEYEDEEDLEISASPRRNAKTLPTKKKKKIMSVAATGIEYPPFPRKVIKKLAIAHGKIGNETLNALARYTEDFFAQAAEDLEAFARHAGRRTINETDAVQLLRRQRKINLQTTTFSLVQKHLPRELSQEIRMLVPNGKARAKRSSRAN
ncbi:centromere kinetochore component CENP-T-domain-containing protein [Trichophaea hybrida]|nr:centromere kinetochore component CENP-T-domain-containing protein [Trichophaea hybrida]